MKLPFWILGLAFLFVFPSCSDDPIIRVPPQSKYGDMRPNNNYPEVLLNVDYLELERNNGRGEYYIFSNRQGTEEIDRNGVMEVGGMPIFWDSWLQNFELGINDTAEVNALKAQMGGKIPVIRRNFRDNFDTELFAGSEIKVSLINAVEEDAVSVLDSALFTWEPARLGSDSSRLLVTINQIYLNPKPDGEKFYSNQFQILDNGLYALPQGILKKLETNRVFTLEFDRVNYAEAKNNMGKRIGMFKNSRYRFDLRVVE